MLNFKIQIANGLLIDINEPIGFNNVDFNLERSKTLHSISSNFAGNSIEFELNNKVHYNVFNNILTEYETEGFLTEVKLFIYWNSSEIFKGNFDFSTMETDEVNYLKVQVINKDKLYLLDKNKSIAVDLLSDKDLDENTVLPAQTNNIGLPPTQLFQESIWEDTNVRDYFLYTSVFNNAQTQTKDEINNSLNWLETSAGRNEGAMRQFHLILAKDNLTDVNIKIEYTAGTRLNYSSGASYAKLWLFYGEERPDLNSGAWFTQINKVELRAYYFLGGAPIDISGTTTYNIPNVPRGSGIWLFWETEIANLGDFVLFENKGSKVTVDAKTKNFYALSNGFFYEDVVKNAVKKLANINNVQFNVNYYDWTFVLNGNLIRGLNDKPFNIKWQDIAKQLNERNLGAYYNESTDTLVIDHRNNILGTNLIGSYGDLAKKDYYFVTEDADFIVNSFNYKYSKYQSQKENVIDGNSGTVHGETEWYIANKGFEGSIQVDLPFVRDSFMIEDIRQKALAYQESTSTNEDDTIVLVESVTNGTGIRVSVDEIMILQGSYDAENNIQSFINDGSFNWNVIGLRDNIGIEINGDYYFIESATGTLLRLTRGAGVTAVYNGFATVTITYTIQTNYLGKMTNDLYNQDFSCRQNIQYWRNTLDVANYYAKKDIINTVYKENKEAVINGLKEDHPIDYLNALHLPRFIDTKILISVNDYFYLQNNKIGYINIYNSKDEQISIYITELKAVFTNGCEQMEATVKGWLKP